MEAPNLASPFVYARFHAITIFLHKIFPIYRKNA